MGRKKRIQYRGYHYITSRSVDYKNIFIQNEDYVGFISILTQLSKEYQFTVHSYTILLSSYHLLIETTQENLSTIVKYLNSKYSKFFNRKYNREGTLWRARYESCFIANESYLSHFLRYIEHIPQQIGITTKIHLYYYSSYRQFVGLDQRLPLLENSIIFRVFNTTDKIEIFFSTLVTKDDIENIYSILRKNKKVLNSLNLKSLFIETLTKEEIDYNILLAYNSGFTQKEIADVLKRSQQAIQQKIKKILEKNNV